MNVSATSPAARPVPVQQQAAPRDADGDHEGTTAASAAAKPAAAVAANGSVDGYL